MREATKRRSASQERLKILGCAREALDAEDYERDAD